MNKKHSKKINSLTFLTLLTIVSLSLSTAQAESNRSQKRLGFTVGINNDPHVNIWGINAKYNIFSWLQAYAGYGNAATSVPTTVSGVPTTVTASLSAYGGGLRLYFPNASFSPYVGLGYSLLNASGNVSVFGSNISASGDLSSIYIPFGLDWQTGIGLNIGLGGAFYLTPTELTSATSVLPSFYIGWFF